MIKFVGFCLCEVAGGSHPGIAPAPLLALLLGKSTWLVGGLPLTPAKAFDAAGTPTAEPELSVPERVEKFFAEHSSIIESSEDAIISKGLDGSILTWNAAAERIFGYTASEINGRPMLSIIPPERADEEAEVLGRIRRGERIAHVETVRLHKNGERIQISASFSPIRDQNGAVSGVSVIARDLIEARRSEDRLSVVVESAPNAIIMVDRAGLISLANAQAEHVFGYRRAELLGQPVEALIPERFRGRHGDYRAAFAADPKSRLMGGGRDLYGLRKNGEEVPIEVGLNPIKTDEGPFVLCSIVDITERKRAEETHRKNLALEEENRRVHEANRVKLHFLATMSHELRTPLNSVIGFAEFLADGKPGPLNARQREYLDEILNSGRHLLRLIGDLLDLAKVEAGKTDFRPERFSPGEAIAEVCSVVGTIAEKKGIHIQTETGALPASVTLDPRRFKQALYNLLSNAIKFTNDGGHIEVTGRAIGADRFQVTVRDNGIGIKAEDLGRLFKEFEQLDSGATRRYQGTGLGLALTRRMVDLQGGEITVKSVLGQGSEFSVTLPLEMKAAPV